MKLKGRKKEIGSIPKCCNDFQGLYKRLASTDMQCDSLMQIEADSFQPLILVQNIPILPPVFVMDVISKE